MSNRLVHTRALTLGRVPNVLLTMSKRVDLAFPQTLLDETWIDRLTRYAELRNLWTHGSAQTSRSPDVAVDDARSTIVESIELLRWIGGIVETRQAGSTGIGDDPPGPAVRLNTELREPRGPGVFLSHSTKDGAAAEQIAKALSAFGYSVWYSDWAIAPGDSIVERINAALARNDTLVVLLSQASVASRWVAREVGSMLMAQLAGESVRILPVMIEECEPPAIMRELKYVNMIPDFQRGLLELVSCLLAGKERAPS